MTAVSLTASSSSDHSWLESSKHIVKVSFRVNIIQYSRVTLVTVVPLERQRSVKI